MKLPIPATQVPTRWTNLVCRIRAGETAAIEELYRASAFLRPYLARTVGWDEAEDIYHDVILEVVKGIRKGALRQPEALMGYLRTIAFRRRLLGLRQKIRSRQESTVEHQKLRSRKPDPEISAIKGESDLILSRVLSGLLSSDREILIRFYVNEEPHEGIEAAMNLSPTQFRLKKSRAKAEFARKCQAVLSRKGVSQSRASDTPDLALAS